MCFVVGVAGAVFDLKTLARRLSGSVDADTSQAERAKVKGAHECGPIGRLVFVGDDGRRAVPVFGLVRDGDDAVASFGDGSADDVNAVDSVGGIIIRSAVTPARHNNVMAIHFTAAAAPSRSA